jgi:hypothetical protein
MSRNAFRILCFVPIALVGVLASGALLGQDDWPAAARDYLAWRDANAAPGVPAWLGPAGLVAMALGTVGLVFFVAASRWLYAAGVLLAFVGEASSAPIVTTSAQLFVFALSALAAGAVIALGFGGTPAGYFRRTG